ncbi:hypothetical protein OE903_20095 [Bacillus sp. B6(2022)]|nr:hypothetical protein [Bacillus sp. B6(2022)]
MLLGARSFSDFVSRVGAVTTIVEADKDMITEHENDLELVEQKEAELNKQLSGLETSLKELETLKKDLSKQQKEKGKVLGHVTEEKEHAHDELGKLENEQEILANQKAAVKSEEARRQKEEAKKAEQAAAEKMHLHQVEDLIKCQIHQQVAQVSLNQLQAVSHQALADVLADSITD